MARSSPRSRARASLALAVALAAGATVSAHRKDELLQAARLGIEPDRVRIELDLTPGISVADAVLGDIDGDRNGSVSADEARAYASRVASAIRLDLDGRPVDVRLTDSAFPSADAMRRGEGTIRMALAAPMPVLADGVHRLQYQNTHRREVGVYLANALVPASDRVAITAQDRDVEQRDLRIEFVLRSGSSSGTGHWTLAALSAVLLALTLACQRALGRA